jgi:hypothetical protein
MSMTTLPTKAGSFRVERSPWLRQELLRPRVTHPPRWRLKTGSRPTGAGLNSPEESPCSRFFCLHIRRYGTQAHALTVRGRGSN